MSRLLFMIEGNDGSGKTTLVNSLKTYFGNRITYSVEPDTIARESLFKPDKLNKSNLWKALHMSESRLRTIKKILKDDIKVHLSDRWGASMMAYQYGHGNARAMDDAIEYCTTCGYEKLNKDDKVIYIYLNISTEEAHARKALQSDDVKNPYDKFPFEWYKEAEHNYKKYLTETVYNTEGQYCDVSVHMVDATLSPTEVFERVKMIIDTIIRNNEVA